MKDNTLENYGELELISIIEQMVLEKTGNELLKDDAFFFDLKNKSLDKSGAKCTLVLNTDMLVSTTDVPSQMNFYQVGRKAILMNISDLIVKGIKPVAILISLGLPRFLDIEEFKELITGMIETIKYYNINYIGGDLNETKEIIINPTVFGFQESSRILFRRGIKPGDLIVANKKFGLTGVGLDILLSKKGNISNFRKYERSIKSVLELDDLGNEAYILEEKALAKASIDSSDGLYKSLKDLMRSNPEVGFEITFDEKLIHEQAFEYSKEYDVSLEKLVFYAGEEFIHLFIIDPEDFSFAYDEIEKSKGKILKIGKVITEEKIYYLKHGQKIELTSRGFEHFSQIS